MRNMEEGNCLKTGTTTIGILCKDGIVLAADKRATAGSFIADNRAKKIHQINDEIAVTIAGTVSDAQLIIKLLKANMKLKDIQTRRNSLTKEVANFLAGLIYGNIRKFSTIPGISHFILGGKDNTGFQIFDIYPDGSLSEVEDFVSSGSGSVMAYGVLEADYKKGITVEEGVKMAVKAMTSALRRDSASGSGYEVIKITSKGIEQVLNQELKIDLKA